jgi:ABC-type sugar transport system substrate-binding protein
MSPQAASVSLRLASWVLLAGLLCFLPALAWAQRVTFINPGKSDEAFWVSATRAMEAAARDLGVELEVRYAERQFPRALELAREIAARPEEQRPHYVIVVNEGAAGPELLRILADKTQVFMAYSGITQPADVAAAGAPRQKFAQWVGSLEPKASEAGYLTARELIGRARARGLKGADGKIHLLAVGGDRSTPTSVQRNLGMRRAVEEARDVVIDQEVNAQFSRQRAQEMAGELFLRFPQARAVWAGSDQMAFGAMQALEARGGTPGKEMLFAGINTSSEALAAVKSGRLAALAGGHFVLGAFALIMIHDYHKGIDFATIEGVALEASMFVLFSPKEVDLFLARYGEDRFDSIDFRRFSKVHNRRLKRYDFSFRQLLR